MDNKRYDIEAVTAKDRKLVKQLRYLRLDEAADRLEELTTKAHNRGHWTGHE